MTIQLNGEKKQTLAQSVAELLAELQSPQTGVAVARNGAVVPRVVHEETPLHDGDEIEIIRAVQGG